jgi:large-conductance mechanosensitive channel
MQLLLNGFASLAMAVIYTALVVGTGFAFAWLVGSLIGEHSKLPNWRAFWDRHINKAFWSAMLVGGGWAIYSLATVSFWSAVLSLIGFLIVAFVIGFLMVTLIDSAIRHGYAD